MIVLEIVFWLTVGLIFWSYLGYPVLLMLLDKKVGNAPALPKDLPNIDVIFAAFNEESVIEEKIRSIYHSDYPTEKLHVHIGSDASTDSTDDIVVKLSSVYPNLHLHRMPGRTGKSGIINHLVSITSSPYILASDANIFFQKGMIASMLGNIMRDRVQLVGGNIVYRETSRDGIAKEEDLYLSFENKIKRRESNIWGFALGVEGGCYMIQRDAFHEIPPLTFMEDFFITMSVIRDKGQVYFDSEALCTEDVSVDKHEEFKRKVRISLGNYQNLNRFADLLVRHSWSLGFAFFSHKVIRWITPILLIISILSSLTLTIFTEHWIYETALAAHGFMLLLFLLDTLLPKFSERSSLLRFVGHFYLMNFALLKGLLIYLQGVESNVWQPTKRAQKSA